MLYRFMHVISHEGRIQEIILVLALHFSCFWSAPFEIQPWLLLVLSFFELNSWNSPHCAPPTLLKKKALINAPTFFEFYWIVICLWKQSWTSLSYFCGCDWFSAHSSWAHSPSDLQVSLTLRLNIEWTTKHDRSERNSSTKRGVGLFHDLFLFYFNP